nr:PTS transporter subunit EIIC [Lactimicrobium massiliense]
MKGVTMDGFFNSKFMQGLQNGGQKLATNPFVSALQSAMMSMMAPIMVGAIFTIIDAVCCNLFHLWTADSTIYLTIYKPYEFTMNTISIWLVFLLGYNYAKNCGLKSPVMSGIDSAVVFLIVASSVSVTEAGVSVMDMTYLGAQGMFIGFLICWVTIRVEKFCVDHNVRIKMPDVCPPALVNGFSAILPLLFAVVPCYLVDIIIRAVSGGSLGLCAGFMFILSYPLNALISVPGMIVLGILAGLMWLFGIHGTMILVSVLMAPMIQAIAANEALFAAGTKLTFANGFNASFLFGCMAVCGGTGNTWPAVIWGTRRAKSKQIQAVSKIALVPGWFGINEPVTFGFPVMYNPVLGIPYVLTIPVNMLITYFLGWRTGFLVPSHIAIMSLLPMGFGGFLGSLSWHNFIWDYIMLIPDALIWIPFMKVYDKQLYEQEQKAAAEEKAAA